MRRRQLLASSTALLVAGCISQGDGTEAPSRTESPTNTDSPTPTTTATPTPVEKATLSVDDQFVQPGVVTLNSPDSIAVRSDDGQFLLVNVTTTDGPALEQSAFTLHVDGEEHLPKSYQYALFKDGNYDVEYTPETGTGWLVFGLQEQVAAEEARLVWPDGEAELSDRVRTRLETPSPPFDVTFEAPETVTEEESPTLSLTVENEGDVAGNCVLALNRVGPDIAYAPIREIVVELDGGETSTMEFDAKNPYSSTGDPNDVTYHLELVGGDRISRTIQLAE